MMDNPNNKAFPFIRVVFDLCFIVRSINKCHDKILTMFISFNEHGSQPQKLQSMCKSTHQIKIKMNQGLIVGKLGFIFHPICILGQFSSILSKV